MTTATLSIKRKTPVCRLHCRKVDADIDLPAISEVFSNLPDATILGANQSKENADGFSYWMASPKEGFEFLTGQKKTLEELQKVLNKYRPEISPLPHGIFTGGWVGFFGYELGGYIEPVSQATDDLQLPLIRLCFYDRLIAYDHSKKAFWLIALELDDDAESPQQKLSFLENLLVKAKTVQVPVPPPPTSKKSILLKSEQI